MNQIKHYIKRGMLSISRWKRTFKIMSYVLFVSLLSPSIASADLIWPGLIFYQAGQYLWWVIILGLMVEYLFIRIIFSLPPMRSIFAVFIANGCSALIGILLIPAGVLIWWLLFVLVIYRILSLEIFASIKLLILNVYDPFSVITVLVIASLINVFVEAYIYKRYFKQVVLIPSKKFWWLLLANLLSVGIALACVTERSANNPEHIKYNESKMKRLRAVQ